MAKNGKRLFNDFSTRELVFQLLLHAVVFTFNSFDKNAPEISTHQFFFFLNYAFGTLVISYFLLPTFFYKKKYLQFCIGVVIIIAGIVIIEELVLEQIFFPDSNRSETILISFALLDIIPIVTVLSGFKFAWDAVRKQRELEQLQAAIKESELQFLKTQINPHFLFNNLNNLYAYAIENSPKTPTIILELSAVLRYMLYECKEKYVALRKEVEQLENFTRLSQLQIEDRGVVNFTAGTIPDNLIIAPLILVVFIENAFKHSQSSQSSEIEIDIQLVVTATGQLKFQCRNNYQPNTNTENLSKGIGLENVQKRLNLLYPDTHHLSVQEQGLYYQVDLTMQLDKASQLWLASLLKTNRLRKGY